MTQDVAVGDDGVARCWWADSAPELRAYHDDEWGRPVGDDRRMYEKLCLEGFQSGLSWMTILRKREGFRAAFASFDPDVVARFGDGDVSRLLADAGIVRNRAKILATIANARATVALHDAGLSLAALMWRHRVDNPPAPKTLSDLPSITAESRALSAELRRHGFAFVGPTTAYSTMQSLGVANDHLRGCSLREVVEAQRAEFVVPV